MKSLERVRLKREDFVIWLGQALSGMVVMPQISSSGTGKQTDVTLVAPKGQAGAVPIMCVPQAQMRDLFAFLATYTKVRPFSAFFRVMPLELVSSLEVRSAASVRNISVAKCVAGAAMAEAWVAAARETERPTNVFPLLLSSLSSALGQAVLGGYDQEVIDWIVSEWMVLRKQSSDPFRSQNIIKSNKVWTIIGSAAHLSKGRTEAEADAELIIQFFSNAFAQGAVQPSMLGALAPLSEGTNFEALILASREERISRFNQVVADFKRRSEQDLRSEFVAGLLLAMAGNGSFDLLRSAREFDGWLDGATTWFGVCAALFDESNLLTYGNSAGRRMVRDIMVLESPFEAPRADINSIEYQFSSLWEVLQSSTHATNSLDVEILPGVLSRVSAVTPQDTDRRREQAETLLRTLDEAGYLLDRARRVAIGFIDNDRQEVFFKSSRRGKSK